MSNVDSVYLRVTVGSATLGPGKADLLEAVEQAGSITGAGRATGMSYKRAWYLIETLNSEFNEPLVEASKGGSRGGGAKLTPTGKLVLKIYRRMQAKALRAIQSDLAKLTARAGPGDEVTD